jgi:hypothetical protein
MAGVLSSLGQTIMGGARNAAGQFTAPPTVLVQTPFVQTGQIITQGAIQNAQANAQTQNVQRNSMGGLTFTDNAFPAATQAAFGGMGGLGYGVGYGGDSSGASIIIPAEAFYQPVATAPSGGAEDYTGLILVAGMILAVILVISMMNKDRR